MVRKIKTIELQLNANVVTRGDSVVLVANLSDLELEELKAQNGRIEFSVENTVLTPTTSDPTSATWTTTGTTPFRPHTANIKLIVNNQPIASGETRLHVIETTALEVSVTPPEVDEGVPIDLQVIRAPTQSAFTRAAATALQQAGLRFKWDVGNKGVVEPVAPHTAVWKTAGMNAGVHRVTATLVDGNGLVLQTAAGPVMATGQAKIRPSALSKGDTLRVALQRSATVRTRDQVFWSLIRSSTAAIGSSNYSDFIERVLCPGPTDVIGRQPVLVSQLNRRAKELQPFTYGVGAYELLKTATQIFLLLECGGCHADIKDIDLDEESARLGETVTLQQLTDRLRVYLGSGHLPYIDRVLENAFPGQREIIRPHCFGVLSSRIQVPCLLELIWSYWHEEAMLAQTIGAITRRFQNMRGPGDRDPLAHLEIDPLRPLNNLLWGYVQDEWNLLTVKRRAYEYDHHYGLTIRGKAVPPLQRADSRSKFLEGFHRLLHVTSNFYKEDNDTTVIADGFPLLNALKEVHLLLAQGAHNQFGDLPWTARAEMLIQQWLLARPEMRDFLQSRAMVPYKEPWMAPVDSMKALQGWSDVTVTHFRDLGAYGEQILLSVRYGDWIDINDEESAKNWARYWRPEIQGYLHAYRAVTGVDLTNPDTVDHTMPAVHLQKRLAMQRAR
jgi:hypothetical protein